MNPAIQITTDKFETSDMALAAVLAMTYTLEDLDFTDLKRIKFSFKKTPELETKVEDFWRKQVTVEPQEFFTSLKFVKARLYNAKPANDQPFYR